jgi:caffeoyl-CoA O-methyltransferase
MRSSRLLPEGIAEYARDHTKPLPPLAEEVLAATRERMGRRASWASGPQEGWFLHMLALTLGARRIVEVGTFTGFGAIMMAAALPDDGQLITCEVDPECIAIARGFFERSPDARKITLREGPGVETLKTLQGPIDLVFIDADKENYVNYYEATLPLLAPNGLIVADNVLWRGRVLAPENDEDQAVIDFAAHVQRDPRVLNVLLTAGDGLMLIRTR